ncbi:Uma2 family endonuclease [Oscillatoria sp. FACHB-1407]|uniref:Uma2 family endonuclease n=1 Tax=Oscillatoria sp. FACHB-1407 TaxID=2692847 RepID=UPI001688ADA0|nr:Uma2 family endonuclease [Oscillatoria sp. FACHB-1407]MBD2465946.1 Uma2 family endonuclease [Oscillatoria sp. FACHB-1407]
MIQANPHSLNADEFIAQYGDQVQYELIDGELIDVEPTGLHEQVIGFIARKLNVEIDRLDLPYIIPHRCLIRLSDDTAFRPDVVVLDRTQLIHEPLWQYQPIITSGAAIQLIAEVVSTNWQNDYARKVEDYALLGVTEYWIVDYLGLGGREYIGKPKQPAITVCQLTDDIYEKRLFRQNDLLTSSTFSELQLQAGAIFAAGQL